MRYRETKGVPTLIVAMLAAIPLAGLSPAADDEPALRPTDDELELMVTAALAEDPVVESYEIVVLADEANVTLHGSVDTEEDRRVAEVIAAGIEGVAEVHNEIDVVDPVYAVYKSDRAIEADFWGLVSERLETVPDSLEIRVLEGKLVLSGRAESRAQRQALVQAAFDAGAILVQHELEIVTAADDDSQP